MICDFCRHEVMIPESRELLIRAWCPNCGAFSDGKERMKLPRVVANPLPSVEELVVRVFPELSLVTASVVERFLKSREKTCTCCEIMAEDSTRHFRGCPLREKYPDHPAAHVCDTKTERNALREKYKDWHLGIQGHVLLDDLMKTLDATDELERVGEIYRSTLKAAQENGTNLWNKVVRVKNLLRVAQPYLEGQNARNPEYLELAALCNEIEKEIGPLEDNTTEEERRMVAERLGIDIEKWAEELRAKVDAAAAKEGETDGIKK